MGEVLMVKEKHEKRQSVMSITAKLLSAVVVRSKADVTSYVRINLVSVLRANPIPTYMSYK